MCVSEGDVVKICVLIWSDLGKCYICLNVQVAGAVSCRVTRVGC